MRTGLLDGDEVLEVAGDDGSPDLPLLLRDDPRRQLDDIARAARSGPRHRLGEVALDAPIRHPVTVFGIGKNYAEHAAETGSEAPSEPIVFAKLASSIAGPHDDIVLPPAAPRRVDYEAELCVVIGLAGRGIPEARAMDHVLGYLTANDVSARDWQSKKPGGQWTLGKSFDTFLPVGPWLVTADELPNASRARITCRVDGELLQDDTADHMIFGIPALVAYLSQVATLQPGDLILTGTPAGVGMGRVPPRWLQPGNVVETEIEGVGKLRNTVAAAPETR